MQACWAHRHGRQQRRLLAGAQRREDDRSIEQDGIDACAHKESATVGCKPCASWQELQDLVTSQQWRAIPRLHLGFMH